MRAAVLVAFSVVVGAGVPAAQAMQPPPPPPPGMIQAPRDPGRKPPPEPVGTGIIRGRVVGADTGTPIRRANVNLSMMPPAAPITTASQGAAPAGAPGAPPVRTTVTLTAGVGTANASMMMQGPSIRPKSATTDAQGAFEFRDLPAGSYRLMASPGQYAAAYLPIAFGAKRPNGPMALDPGTPIALADGQLFDKATLALPRGAVITGRVTDDNGDPLARVQVYTIMYFPGSSRGSRNNSAQTDDLGQFRLFGLVPGDYVVAAEARGNTFVPPNAPPESEDDKIGFMTTFFPSTADEASAQRVRARAGGETPGVEIRLVSGRLFHISGMVTDSQGRSGVRTNGTLFKRAAGSAVVSTFGFSTDEQGRFQMRNIPPGTYRLTVRQQPQGPRNADGSMPDQGEFASLPLSINADLDNLLVTTSPGATITGVVIFENGPPQLQGSQASFQMRVNALAADPDNMINSPSPQPGLVSPELAFTMKGLSGEVLLRTNAPGNTLKAVLLGAAEDITDTPHEFKTGERVTLVMTSRAASLEGDVTDAAGKPVADASIMLFSDDKSAWRGNSIRTRRTGVDAAGHYRLFTLLPGRYYLVALPRERTIGMALNDPSAFEALAKEATTVVVGEDEQRQADLKISVGGGGGGGG